MRPIFLHFVTFRFVLYYLIAYLLSSMLSNMVLDLDRSISLDATAIEENLIQEIERVKQVAAEIELNHDYAFGSSFVPQTQNETQHRDLFLGLATQNETESSQYVAGISRKQWLLDNVVWFSYLIYLLPWALIIHMLWYGWPAGKAYHQFLVGVPSSPDLRHLARQRILGLSKIGMIHGCILSLVFGSAQWICEFHFLPYSGDRWFLIPLSAISFALAFGALIMGLFDPLILSLVPKLCQDDELYQSRSESWFPGIAFRIRLMIASGIVLPFFILFLSQLI